VFLLNQSRLFTMEVLAAGLCAPGCGAIASAIAGGPVLGAVSMVAAVGYGIYSLASGEKDTFQDAIEGDGEDPDPVCVVQVAPNGGATSTSQKESSKSTASFL
jgi:hypothetical protein